ncbi:circularly permuted type 2 ATP-grasp protein [Blastococcus sp. MG754426]|uniref:circularly permuted type 2 ATP-grasp protein n=2 Tax=Blastococcus TaxID=38501 RepID=UPI001EF1083A|nr:MULTISPECIES: circularly permuted type 2 ATP-grasp protein [unclassified Blastococcus]MCF6506136.1 circularly permuted type 2 ATP-grasp protein [Blastococcus sp. MG754426]MCF6510486.1 circularly permuted type 2 ATP-grasp protein [Blastococcus sp. MG754427]
MSGELFAGYPTDRGDEAVGADGRLRDGWAGPVAALERLGAAGLAAAEEELARRRQERGVVVGTWADGRQQLRPVVQDPVPRVLDAATWRALSAGVAQRHRALNAFLADAYRPAGRRRGDPDRAAEIVRAGAVPEWAVANGPGRDPEAVARAWPGQPRATVAAADLVRTVDGRWAVVRDHLRAPSGIGYALADRECTRAVLPELLSGAGDRLRDPADAVPLLAAALADAAPPGVTGPRTAVLTQGEGEGAWFEHRVLAEALDAPLVRAGDLWPRSDGGVEAVVDGGRVPVDVLYRRFDDALLGAYPTGAGVPLDLALTEAVRARRLGLANVPGNAVADDAAGYAWVPAMIRFYLGEEPLLASARTWVLADPAAWAEVADRLHELEVESVAGYGGRRVVHGPSCPAAGLAALRAEIAAAPHRFVAREPLAPSTAPALAGGCLHPRPVGLRVFSVAGRTTATLPLALTRVGGDGLLGKDTWLLR